MDWGVTWLSQVLITPLRMSLRMMRVLSNQRMHHLSLDLHSYWKHFLRWERPEGCHNCQELMRRRRRVMERRRL